MKKIIQGFMCLTLMAGFTGTASAQTVAVGVSPATYEIVLHDSQSAELDFGLSRNETMGDFSFSVEVEQDVELVQVSEEEVVIRDGENTQTYSVDLVTSRAPLGEHEVTVNFRDNNQKEGGEVLAIRYGLQSRILATVVSLAEYDQLLSTSGVEVTNVHVPKNTAEVKEPLMVKFDIANPGEVYIDTLDYRVDVKNQDGEVVESISKNVQVALSPYKNVQMQEALEIDEVGDYSIEIFVERNGQVLGEGYGSFQVDERIASLSFSGVDYAIIGVGVLCILLGLRLFMKRP